MPRAIVWKEAVYQALVQYAQRHHSRIIKRQVLIREELPSISAATGSIGLTPHQTLSRVLQELRDDGVLEFVDSGTYLLVDHNAPLDPLAISQADLPGPAVDAGLRNNVIRFDDAPTSSTAVLARRRLGQDRLRVLTIANYGGKCAFDDVSAERLLHSCHIVPWSEDPENRGNLRNTICLCEVHHVLFDGGFIALSDDYNVLRKEDSGSVFLNRILGLPVAYRLPNDMSFWPSREFLSLHRKRMGFA